MRIHDRLAAMLALGVLHVHSRVEGTGPVQGVQGHQVLEAVGGELLHELAHPRALHLEHAGGVGAPEHLVDLRVVQRQMFDVEVDPALAKELNRVLDDGEVPQPEEVHLEQAEAFHPVHIELRDDAP